MTTIMEHDTFKQRITELERLNASLHSDLAALTEAADKVVKDRDRLQV